MCGGSAPGWRLSGGRSDCFALMFFDVNGQEDCLQDGDALCRAVMLSILLRCGEAIMEIAVFLRLFFGPTLNIAVFVLVAYVMFIWQCEQSENSGCNLVTKKNALFVFVDGVNENARLSVLKILKMLAFQTIG